MPKVFLPTVPHRFNFTHDRREPSHDISPAEVFGTLYILLDLDEPIPDREMAKAIRTVLLTLDRADIQPDDYIVAIGDPVMVAAAVAFAIKRNGRVNMLRWDRFQRCYNPIEVKL